MISSNKVGTLQYLIKIFKKKFINCKQGDLIFIHDNLLHKADKNKHLKNGEELCIIILLKMGAILARMDCKKKFN